MEEELKAIKVNANPFFVLFDVFCFDGFMNLVVTGDYESLVVSIGDLCAAISNGASAAKLHNSSCDRISQRSACVFNHIRQMPKEKRAANLNVLTRVHYILKDIKSFVSKFAAIQPYSKIKLMKCTSEDVRRFEDLNEVLCRVGEDLDLQATGPNRSQEDCADLKQDMDDMMKEMIALRKKVGTNISRLQEWETVNASVTDLVSDSLYVIIVCSCC